MLSLARACAGQLASRSALRGAVARGCGLRAAGCQPGLGLSMLDCAQEVWAQPRGQCRACKRTDHRPLIINHGCPARPVPSRPVPSRAGQGRPVHPKSSRSSGVDDAGAGKGAGAASAWQTGGGEASWRRQLGASRNTSTRTPSSRTTRAERRQRRRPRARRHPPHAPRTCRPRTRRSGSRGAIANSPADRPGSQGPRD